VVKLEAQVRRLLEQATDQHREVDPRLTALEEQLDGARRACNTSSFVSACVQEAVEGEAGPFTTVSPARVGFGGH